ncbi:hypothetical protein OTERR_06990 [Oryzomicrobium terrae]|uniref:HTH lysR-type domain-containing protein n=1 Tax=Oryzomicrobium terrae TaxID=1735038 RepID=A0A5C1E682_9RHOO|nr:LysR family transcriptional regulator [Oryzomicrobium terrae]QEL64175.1 hypothetical protein OTERR_06990 [Oryzomicrobium terrae]
MDLKRLHYFCTIADQGQISRAARVLHMAQPPLSQRLRELEEELGTPLFLRQGRELQLTDAGRLLYRRARDILRSVDATKEEVIRAATQAGPTLRIGLTPTSRALWLSRFETLRALFQDRQIGLVVGDSSYLEHLLETGQIDAAFMQPPLHPENFRIQRLASSPPVAVLPRRLHGTVPPRLTLADLAPHPLLLLRRSFGVSTYERLLRSFHELGLTPNVALYSSDVSLLLELMRRGFAGIAVVPESEAGDMGEDYWIRPLEADLPDYHLSLVCRSGEQDAALVERLLAFWAD